MTGASHQDAVELSDEQQGVLEALLKHRLEEIQAALATSKEDARPVELELSIGRLTRVDAMQQQQMAAAYRRRLETQLTQIQSAFTRLAAGTYGECVRCDEPIGYGRLSVQPEAPLCVRCQGNPNL